MIIKKLIKSRGFSIDEVAKALGTTQGALSQSISGNPTVEKLRAIAKVINCDVSEFFQDENKYKPPFLALIKAGDKFFEAHSLDELKEIIKQIEQ